MNTADLIEKLKILLAEKMLEIEELKREQVELQDRMDAGDAYHKEEVRQLSEKGAFLDGQNQGLSARVSELEDKIKEQENAIDSMKGKMDRFDGFDLLIHYPEDKSTENFEMKGKVKILQKAIELMFKTMPEANIKILARDPGRYKGFFATWNAKV